VRRICDAPVKPTEGWRVIKNYSKNQISPNQQNKMVEIRERKKRTIVKRDNILFIPNISNYGSNLSKSTK
jgi:hypothetical protein